MVEGQGGASPEGVGELRLALGGTVPHGPAEKDGFAGEIDEVDQATSQIERAVALCKGVSEGRGLELDQLGIEVGALLDCLERLDRGKQHKKALRMARALSTLLMLLKRWSDLLKTLRIGKSAAEALGDLEAVAWAEHEIGTLRLVAGDVDGADRELCRAKEIRERIGDRRGLAATNRNLGSLCERLRQMVRSEELVRREAPRWPTTRLALFATLFAFAFTAAGFALGSLSGNESTPSRAATDNQSGASPRSSSNGTAGGGPNEEPAAGSAGTEPAGEPAPGPEPEPAPEPESEPAPDSELESESESAPEPELEPEEESFR